MARTGSGGRRAVDIATGGGEAEHRVPRAAGRPTVGAGPGIACGGLAVGIACDTLHAIRLIGYMPRWMRNSIGLVLIALGLWYIVGANIIFRREKTPFQPWRPTRIIAARAIYGYSRNPLYQGFIILVLGLGVPLRSSTSVGDGLDALLSIVQMPPGVPVATVGVDNSKNAALLAARILALP